MAPAETKSRAGNTQQTNRRRFRDWLDAHVIEMDRGIGTIAVDDQSESKKSLAGGEVKALGGEGFAHRARQYLAAGKLRTVQLDILASARKVLCEIAAPRVHVGADLEKAPHAARSRIDQPVVADQVSGFIVGSGIQRQKDGFARITSRTFSFLKIAVAQNSQTIRAAD